MQSAEGSCRALKKFENRFLRVSAQKIRGWDEETTCKALAGWRIEVHPLDQVDMTFCGTSWLFANSLCIIGYTHVAERTIELLNTDFQHNALAHELVHVVDYATIGHSGHCNWKARGVLNMIEAVTGEREEEKECEL